MTAGFPIRRTVVAFATALLWATSAHAQSQDTASPQADPHAGHTMPAAAPSSPAPSAELPSFIPRLTDEDRKAAFPDLPGHAVHDRAVQSFILLDQFEWQASRETGAVSLDSKGWIGGDRNRIWLRAEGQGEGRRVEDAELHALFGRQISRWWDVVAGMRQDFRPGPAQTWAAVGVQGLAPYWFEIEATAYVGAAGQTRARFEAEYELLLTKRLVLQPRAELELAGKSDPERGVGAGISTTDFGLRVRYEIRRELAPYVGLVWRNTWGKTADFAEAAGEERGGARLVTGLRLWF